MRVFCVVEKSITFLTVFERRRINRRRRRRRRGFLATRGAETVLQRETNLLKTPGDDELGVVVELWRCVRRAGAAFRMRAARRCRRVAARRCRRVRGSTARRRPEGQLRQRSSARRLRRSPAIGGLRANLAGSWRPRAEGCDRRAAGDRGPARLRRACGRRAVAPLEWGLSETPRPGIQILEEALRQGLDGLGPRALHVGHAWLVLWLIPFALLSRPLSSRALGCSQGFLLQHDVLRPR